MRKNETVLQRMREGKRLTKREGQKGRGRKR